MKSACLPVCLSACLAVLTAESCLATEVVPTRLDEAGWTYTPIAEDGEVEQLLILRNPDQLPAGIIGLLTEAQPDGSWVTWAWTNAAYEEIVLHIADQTGQPLWAIADGLNDDIVLDWELLNDPEVVGVAPEPLGSGVLSGDPLEPVIENSDDPLTVLEILELLGYPAVSKLSVAAPPLGGGTAPIDPNPHPDECIALTAPEWFDILAESFEAEIVESESGFWVLQDLLDALQQQGCTCQPRRWYSNEAWSAWSCGGSWTVRSGPNLNSQFQSCGFDLERIVTRSGTMIVFCQAMNCSITRCTQFNSCAAYQSTTCYSPAIPTMPPGGTCQGVSPCNPQTSIACLPDPFPRPQCTGWFPACPCP